jgi:hypothetical protein
MPCRQVLRYRVVVLAVGLPWLALLLGAPRHAWAQG